MNCQTLLWIGTKEHLCGKHAVAVVDADKRYSYPVCAECAATCKPKRLTWLEPVQSWFDVWETEDVASWIGQLPSHVETIRCPSCGTVQQAMVEHTWPWAMFCHFCEKCEYIIMESEWERVERTA